LPADNERAENMGRREFFVGGENMSCHWLYWMEIREGDFFLNNQPDALIIQIYSLIKLYTFRVSSLPINRSFPLHIRHFQAESGWNCHPDSAWKRSSHPA
jgi:hypothetical protein